MLGHHASFYHLSVILVPYLILNWTLFKFDLRGNILARIHGLYLWNTTRLRSPVM